MHTFLLTVATPDGSRFNGEAVRLSLRGTEGDLAVMAGHVPFITAVKPGECRILLPDESEIKATTQGGLLSVSKEAVTLLCECFETA